MANDLSARPLKIDTAMASGAALGRPLRVIKVYWFNPTTAGHLLSIIEPASGKKLLDFRAEAANQSQVIDFSTPQIWRDFRVDVLDSGTVLIYTV